MFAGKSADEWIHLLRSGDDHEQCAAAFALAELGPDSEPVRSALLGTLHDPSPAVQVAVQIAIGFVYVPVENRLMMFSKLVGDDADERRRTMQSLDDLRFSKFEGTTSAPEERSIVELKNQAAKVVSSEVIPITEPAPLPDIAVVTKAPWWLLLGGLALSLTLAWLLRELWWSKWVMLVIAGLAAVALCYHWSKLQGGTITPTRYRARVRPACTALCAGVAGFGIGFMLPTCGVYIDNASPVSVHITVDERDWLDLAAGESARRTLGQGKHRITIHSADGKEVLDEFDVNAPSYGPFVFNVLGAQVYFEGLVQYGVHDGGMDIKANRSKWIAIPQVDYLFREVPHRIESRNPVNKTFFVKGKPP